MRRFPSPERERRQRSRPALCIGRAEAAAHLRLKRGCEGGGGTSTLGTPAPRDQRGLPHKTGPQGPTGQEGGREGGREGRREGELVLSCSIEPAGHADVHRYGNWSLTILTEPSHEALSTSRSSRVTLHCTLDTCTPSHHHSITPSHHTCCLHLQCGPAALLEGSTGGQG